jgi:hypothetical protein
MNAISQVKLASCKHLITQSDFWGLIIFFIQFLLAMFAKTSTLQSKKLLFFLARSLLSF